MCCPACMHSTKGLEVAVPFSKLDTVRGINIQPWCWVLWDGMQTVLPGPYHAIPCHGMHTCTPHLLPGCCSCCLLAASVSVLLPFSCTSKAGTDTGGDAGRGGGSLANTWQRPNPWSEWLISSRLSWAKQAYIAGSALSRTASDASAHYCRVPEWSPCGSSAPLHLQPCHQAHSTTYHTGDCPLQTHFNQPVHMSLHLPARQSPAPPRVP